MGILTLTGHLWDLRRGDADDNRSSPHGRGWRALALSTAMEFNLLTAVTSFIALVLVPALVVGLAVPVVMILGRQKLATAALIVTQPVAAVITLAVLVALAFWIARPLLRMALDNFWHLHYTLVFPLFVALREMICALLERCLPGRLEDRQLHQLRRGGAIAATVLLAGGGLLAAWSAGFSTYAGLDDLRAVSARALGRAALRNAAAVLGVSTMLASLYWLWRELTFALPVLNWTQGPPPVGARTVRIAHLSDLHLVGERYGYRMESGTDGPCGNAPVAQALCALERLDASRAVDRILVTGDITDAGTRAEWVEFLELVRQRPGLRDRLLFVPGNHDVNIVDRTNPGRLDLPWSAAQALRKLRVMLALDALQGASVHVVDHANGALGPSLEEYLRTGERPALLRDLAERGTRPGRQEVDRVWDSLFPMIVPPSGDDCGVILLDSNARRHFSLTNAIGVIGRQQLRAFAAILRASPGRGWIVVVHHHLVEYPIPSLGLDERIGVVLVNAPDVLRVIASHDVPVLVLHGHRHRDWIGTCGDVVLCSAPSVTLGDKGANTRAGSFSLYDVAIDAGGRMHLAASERVPLV